jgi:hypothetical protein
VDVEGYVSAQPVLHPLSVVTLEGSGFGSGPLSGNSPPNETYLTITDLTTGATWGSPGDLAYFQLLAWSQSQITFQVPSDSGWWANASWMPYPGNVLALSVQTPQGASNSISFVVANPPVEQYQTVVTTTEYEGPGTNYPTEGSLPSGAVAGLLCQGTGQIVPDPGSVEGTSDIWDQLANGYWVSDTEVSTPGSNAFSPGIPPCTGWEDNPYQSGATGYDISFPQCASASSSQLGNGPPTPYTVDIVGVDGEPGGWNPCLAAEVAWDSSANTALETYIVPDARQSSTPTGENLCDANAWCRWGYATAAAAYAYGTSQLGGVTSQTWMLDVENYPTGNGNQAWQSCSSSQSTGCLENIAAIEGNLYFFLSHSLRVGIYSSPGEWDSITGGWSTLNGPFAQVGNWLALWEQSNSNSPPSSCTTAANPEYLSFSNGPLWILQYGPTGGSGGDSWDGDMACFNS